MRRRVPVAESSDEQPPPELLSYRTRASSPEWTAEGFAVWLRARAAWRDAHTAPLPGLPGRERVALAQLKGLPSALVQAEREAPTRGRTEAELRSSLRERSNVPARGDVSVHSREVARPSQGCGVPPVGGGVE